MKKTLALIVALGCSVACALPPALPPHEHADAREESTVVEAAPRTGDEGNEAVSPSPQTAAAGVSHVQHTSAPVSASARGEAPGSAETEQARHPDSLRVDRGEGELPLWVPRNEELSFRVVLELGLLGDVNAGKVVLSSGVERYVSGLPSPGASKPAKGELETGWIMSHASGSYGGYHLDHELRSRLLPQTWPRVFYTDTQSGSENRRRELKLGELDGALTATSRSDGHCKGCQNPEHFVESTWAWGKPSHCAKCKAAAHRVWKAPVRRTIPAGTVDMLSAVYLARSLVTDGRATTTFTLIDKQTLWQVNLARGKRRRIATPAGTFDAQEIKLSTSVPRGETRDSTGFEGMFGIRGTIQIWLEANTGVPVLIEGELPVPVIGSLDVRVELEKSRGTPPSFAPAR